MLLFAADPGRGDGGDCAAGTGDPIITDVRLEEMGFGICEGTTDFQDNPDNPIYPLFAAPETYRIPVEGGESLEDLYARTGAF